MGGNWDQAHCVNISIVTIRVPLAITVLSCFMLSSRAHSLDNEFGTALGLAGLDVATARFDPTLTNFFFPPRPSTQLFENMWQDPWEAGFVAGTLVKSLEPSSVKPEDTVSLLSRCLGGSTRRNLIESPIKKLIKDSQQPQYLKALLTRFKAEGKLLGSVPDLSSVPDGTQQAAAVVLRAIDEAEALHNAALAQISPSNATFRTVISTSMETEEVGLASRFDDMLGAVDLRPLFAAGSDLCEAAVEAQSLLAMVPKTAKYKLMFTTKWGSVVLSGGTNDQLEGEIALSIDTGGDDVYVDLPSTKGLSNWASIVLDSVGNDRYVSDLALLTTDLAQYGKRRSRPNLGPAGAAFGFAIVADGQGDDAYISHETGLGFAYFGGGAIFDTKGSDRYIGYKNAIGGAYSGFGLVEDGSGDDVYRGFTQVQGFGGMRGIGALVDRSGRDQYIADDATIDFPSSQSPQHNNSFAQGAGLGRRADYLDGISINGGVGLLIDLAGNDRYSCGVFGQGVGYWAGVGCLLDHAGDDTYNGQWYVQGAAAHHAVGLLCDDAGDDTYTAPMNMAMGAGHDLSVGFLADGGGNDRYNGCTLSLGAANANGIGIFTDASGDDFYKGAGVCLGQSSEAPAGTLRERCLSLGVFQDLGGEDSYPVTVPFSENGKRQANWVARREPSQSQVGVFLDR